ncbi:peptidase [Georgenia yuyongxinii]|uniref:Peptidase n=1 Tax=Georgenia yuyongxinii TaxID=2589797 RepID=A0A5B8BZR9_9MICO|nr:S8 family peptidase [Georgenia yuyongxinii]QDC23307.1 peptidase [Georgenia yuyongxinii]
MTIHPWSRLRRRGLAAAAAVGVAIATLPAAATATAAPNGPSSPRSPAASPVAPAEPAITTEFLAEGEAPAYKAGRYVVVMRDEPVIAYEGGVAGITATKPAEGEKFEPDTAAANSYRGHLKARQNRAARAAAASPVYTYTEAVSGFAAELSAEQAEQLAKDPTVLSVTPDVLRQPDTADSPDVLGLTGRKGVWDQLGGTKDLRKGAGSGVIVGVLDSGIRPEHPSFADKGMPKPKGWRGTCDTGAAPRSTFRCSNKLVGARYFVQGFGAEGLATYESLSPLDVDGHGTHTASTAAGNHGVTATIDGASRGVISGMAPAAHVAAYKVCWDDNAGGGGCANSDIVAAIDRAVADGVDVINFSISGTSSNYLDPTELAFMYAADGGVFVAASSGNTGPAPSTTNHPSPWLTTVAASTHTVIEGTLVTGDGARYIGVSNSGTLQTPAPMVLSDSIPAAGADTQSAALCLPGSLDAAAAAGAVVVCDRGVNPRVEKSQTVKDAGGVAMVLVNPTPSSLDPDAHVLPTIHLQNTARDAVRAYVAGNDAPTGRILGTNEGSTTQVPEVAAFSSRGPSLGAGGDLLKPDISAPGVGVLAAYSPVKGGRSFDYASGTSMSAPHVAGLAALIKQEHRRWSPAAVKSAMMTTARDHASTASNDPFASGAGFVEPRKFLDPGLVYDAGQSDWWDFLAGQGVTYADGSPVSTNPIDASDLNLASVAIGDLVGEQTVTRTITNVSGRPAVFRASVDGLDGVDVTVTPTQVRLTPGRSADVTITFTAAGAPLGAYATGHLTWTSDRGHVARSPLAVRPLPLSAPAQVTVPVDATGVEIPVVPGFTGTLGTKVTGLVPGDVTAATAQNAGGGAFVVGDPRNHTQDFTVTGTKLVRIELKSANPTGDDLDLYVTRRGSNQVIAAATTPAANEVIYIGGWPAGEYTIHVQAWSVADAAPMASFDVRVFQPDGDAGTLVLDPAALPVTAGTPVTLTGALRTDAATPYFGRVELTDGSRVIGQTAVSVG